MTTSNSEITSGTTESGAAETGSPAPGAVPTGNDVPRSASALVFLRDRGIFMLWGLLIVAFTFWCNSPCARWLPIARTAQLALQGAGNGHAIWANHCCAAASGHTGGIARACRHRMGVVVIGKNYGGIRIQN